MENKTINIIILHSITALCPYEHKDAESPKHYISIGDTTGTLRLLKLPRALWEKEPDEVSRKILFHNKNFFF